MGPHPLCGRIILGYAASHRCGMKSVPLEGFGGMPKTLRQAPTTSGIQQASGIMAYVDSVHSGGDVGIGDVTVHTHALYGLISQHVVSENLVCSFAVVRQLFGCNLLAFWLSTYLPFMFFVLWPLVWSLCDLPSRMPICDYYLHFLVRCGLAVIMLFRATRSNVKRLMYAFLFDNPSAKPTRVARPARFVGFRRHKPVRRRKSSSIRFSKCCCRVLLTLFYASLLWKVQSPGKIAIAVLTLFTEMEEKDLPSLAGKGACGPLPEMSHFPLIQPTHLTTKISWNRLRRSCLRPL